MNKTGKRVYLDHAATTQPREEVIEVMDDVFRHHWGNPSSFYAEGHDGSHIVEDARARFARCINARPEEIFFTSCGSESDNWAIKGVAYSKRNQAKHIITSSIEHHAVLHTTEFLERAGYEVTYLPVDEYGRVRVEDVEKALRDDTILVSIMMANNEVGTIQPIKEIAQLLKPRKILFHSDAVQALGAIPIDAEDLGVDMMSFSGHKLYGPKGIGAIYIRKGVRFENLIHGGAQEKSRRAGTENSAFMLGFAKALELATASLPEESRRQAELRDWTIQEIRKRIPHAKLNGDPVHRLPNNINFSFEFLEGESMLLLLDAQGYSCSSGSACTSASLDPSHVLIAMGLPHEIAHGSLRATLGRDNTKEQMAAFVDDLEQIVTRLRAMSPLYEDFQKGRIVKALIP